MAKVKTPKRVEISGFNRFVAPLGLPNKIRDYGNDSTEELFRSFKEAFDVLVPPGRPSRGASKKGKLGNVAIVLDAHPNYTS